MCTSADSSTSDTLTITTVNNAVTEALAAAKEEHRSEMEALRTELHDLKVTVRSTSVCRSPDLA